MNVLKCMTFLRTYFRKCTNIKNHVPVRPWFDDPDEEEQWGCGYRDDMIAQFKQNFYNKSITLQDRGKDEEIDTLENRIKLWISIISNARGQVTDSLYDYNYNDEELDETVRGWDRRKFPERRDLKKLLGVLRCKRVRKTLKFLETKFTPNYQKRIMSQTKQTFITLMTFGV